MPNAVRRASMAAAKQQKAAADSARGSTCCRRFFHLLRVLNLLAALTNIFLVLLLLGVYTMAPDETDSMRPCMLADLQCRKVLEDKVAFVGVSVTLCWWASLTVGAECCRCLCLARYFGFIASPLGKGVYSIFCGLATAWFGNFLDDSGFVVGAFTGLLGEGRVLGGADASLMLFGVGMASVATGLMYALFGWCNCIAPDALACELRDYRLAMRSYRGGLMSDQDDASTPTARQVAEMMSLMESAGGTELVQVTTRNAGGHLVTIDVDGHATQAHRELESSIASSSTRSMTRAGSGQSGGCTIL
jgi:hypothetical protein